MITVTNKPLLKRVWTAWWDGDDLSTFGQWIKTQYNGVVKTGGTEYYSVTFETEKEASLFLLKYS